jgi:hypothetical protein
MFAKFSLAGISVANRNSLAAATLAEGRRRVDIRSTRSPPRCLRPVLGADMPVSLNVFDSKVKEMIRLCEPASVLDIGCGAGKYGKIVRSIEAETGRTIAKTCVEIEKETVIDRYQIDRIYNNVINDDAVALPIRYPRLTGDLAIIGDMIEHLTKSQGIDLLEYLQYRFRHIILVVPVDWVSFDYKDHLHEAHISIWRPVDIARFSGSYCVERLAKKNHRFVLAVINAITLSPRDHFVVRDASPPGADLPAGDQAIECGYLNREAGRPRPAYEQAS